MEPEEIKKHEGGRKPRFIGLFLFVISWIFWVLALIVTPLLPLDTHIKVILGGGLYIIREITFYLSLFILGKGFVTWFYRRSSIARGFARTIRSIFRKPVKAADKPVDVDTTE